MAKNAERPDSRSSGMAILERLRANTKTERPADPDEQARVEQECAEDERRFGLLEPYRTGLDRLAAILRKVPLPRLDLDGHRPSTPCEDARELIKEAGLWSDGLRPTDTEPPPFSAADIEALRLCVEGGSADAGSAAKVRLRPGPNGCVDCGMDVTFTYGDGAFRATEPCPFLAGVTPTFDLPVPSGKLVFGTNEIVARFPEPARIDGLPYSRAREVGLTEALFREFGCVHFESICHEAAGLYRRSPTRYAVGRPVWRDDTSSKSGMRLVHPRGTRVDTGLANHDYAGFAELAVFERFGGRLAPGETFLLEVPPGTYRFRLPVLEKRRLEKRRVLLTLTRL